MYVELENRAGKDVWVLIRVVDLPHYKKSAVVKLRKRVRGLEQEVVALKKQAKCAEGILVYTNTMQCMHVHNDMWGRNDYVKCTLRSLSAVFMLCTLRLL